MCKVHFNSINWISVYSLINLGFTLSPDTTGADKCLQIDPVKKNNVSAFPRLSLMRKPQSLEMCPTSHSLQKHTHTHVKTSGRGNGRLLVSFSLIPFRLELGRDLGEQMIPIPTNILLHGQPETNIT